jgi:hypothetical protein
MDHKGWEGKTAILGGLGFFVIWEINLGGKDCIVTVGYLIISLRYKKIKFHFPLFFFHLVC